MDLILDLVFWFCVVFVFSFGVGFRCLLPFFTPRDTASKIPGKTQQEKIIQDRLLRAAQALQNYGVQLKILTSVKASRCERRFLLV
jgi:hypothetical protein